MNHVEEASFVLVANGVPDSPPVSAVAEYLGPRARSLTVVLHPLSRDDPAHHHVEHWHSGQITSRRTIRRPSRPPMTYALDPFVPIRRPRVDGWLAFSNLAAVHGIARRRVGLAQRVAYWAVDFVPDRFGAGRPVTRAYDFVDRYACRHVDLRIELTEAARNGRSARLGLAGRAASVHVAPIGVWLDRVPTTDEDGWRARRVVYTGHLVPRQGVTTLVRALALMPDVVLDITGRGPQEAEIRALAARLGVADRVKLHGFVQAREVERLVASGSVAAAPYADEPDSFSRYADPSKIRTYLAAGVPVVLTRVPPSAEVLERHAGASVVPDDPAAFAQEILRLLDTPEEWRQRRANALEYSRGFDWGRILPVALERFGFIS